jgi:hypothetical protein
MQLRLLALGGWAHAAAAAAAAAAGWSCWWRGAARACAWQPRLRAWAGCRAGWWSGGLHRWPRAPCRCLWVQLATAAEGRAGSAAWGSSCRGRGGVRPQRSSRAPCSGMRGSGGWGCSRLGNAHLVPTHLVSDVSTARRTLGARQNAPKMRALTGNVLEPELRRGVALTAISAQPRKLDAAAAAAAGRRRLARHPEHIAPTPRPSQANWPIQ